MYTFLAFHVPSPVHRLNLPSILLNVPTSMPPVHATNNTVPQRKMSRSYPVDQTPVGYLPNICLPSIPKSRPELLKYLQEHPKPPTRTPGRGRYLHKMTRFILVHSYFFKKPLICVICIVITVFAKFLIFNFTVLHR
jgi:hypothetical protein